MSRLVARTARVLDVAAGHLIGSRDVVIEAVRIQHVGPVDRSTDAADVIDVGGRTVMPGLIDLHFAPSGSRCRALHAACSMIRAPSS